MLLLLFNVGLLDCKELVHRGNTIASCHSLLGGLLPLWPAQSYGTVAAAVCEADSLYLFKCKLKTHLFTLCLNELLTVHLHIFCKLL